MIKKGGPENIQVPPSILKNLEKVFQERFGQEVEIRVYWATLGLQRIRKRMKK